MPRSHSPSRGAGEPMEPHPMAQTSYKAPPVILLFYLLSTALFITFIALISTVGRQRASTWIVFLLGWISFIPAVILDPKTCIRTRGRLEDGTAIKIKRPIVGFKKYEVLYGLTGNYEVSQDGWRHEPAHFVF